MYAKDVVIDGKYKKNELNRSFYIVFLLYELKEKTITGLYSSLELPKIIKNILNILINVEIKAAT